ncbi:meiosis regulator and mRNA stability factor 1-like isoform X2 [Lineus longissimus]
MEGEDVYGSKIGLELLTESKRALLTPKEKKEKQGSPAKHQKKSPKRHKKMRDHNPQPVPSKGDASTDLNIPISSSDNETPSSMTPVNAEVESPSPSPSVRHQSPSMVSPQRTAQVSPYGRSQFTRPQGVGRGYPMPSQGQTQGDGVHSMGDMGEKFQKETRNEFHLPQQSYQGNPLNHDPGGGDFTNPPPYKQLNQQYPDHRPRNPDLLGHRNYDHQGNHQQGYGRGYRSNTSSPYEHQHSCSSGPYRSNNHSPNPPRPYSAGGYRSLHGSPGSNGNRSNPDFRSGSPGNLTYNQRNYRESYFQPIRSHGSSPRRMTPSPGFGARMMTPSPHMNVDEMGNVGSCLELMVTNLDYNISAREWKKILFTTFQQQVQVQNVYIQTQSDGSNMGVVCVPTIDEARLAIAQFHRKKIGYRRIHVALVRKDNGLASATIRSEAVALLKEATGQTLPLFKFIELFEKRFHQSVSVSELYQMKDVIEISDMEGSGRMVNLLHRYRDSPAPHDSSDIEVEEIFESPICLIHCPEGSEFYMTALDSAGLPNVVLQLKGLAPQVHSLLQAHNGSMPLMSFPACYAAEFGPIYQVSDGGVPLEHLLTCIPGIQVDVSKSGVKKIHWTENKAPSTIECGRFLQSPALNQMLNQLSKEVVDLLKSCPQCRMPFSKFIPAYHHHFGRQCRVADYGYTKLAELFKAIPHVLQVIGTGNRGILTLTHRAQVKRFTSDLLRLLKSQTSKAIMAIDIPAIFMKVFNKVFDMSEYGVCYLEDILLEIPDTVVMVEGHEEQMVIAIPRRDQTVEEIERTKKFITEVVDLLRHSPQCRMPFNKFIPSYHHHFGRQCRVADYGFSKLIDLFESIPDVINIEDDGDEKILCLTEPELIKVLADQVMSLLESCPEAKLPATEFLTAFMRFHGHSLQLQDFGVHNVIALMKKIKHVAKVEGFNGKTMISLVDRSQVQQRVHRVLLILLEQPGGNMHIPYLKERYRKTFGEHLDIAEIKEDLKEYIMVSDDLNNGIVKLVALMEFARDVRSLLRIHKGRLPMQHFGSAYRDHFGTELKPAAYGFPNIDILLQSLPHLLQIKGKGFKRVMYLNTDFLDKFSHQIAYSPVPQDSDYMTTRDQNNTPSKDSGIPDIHSDEDLMLVASRSNTPMDLLAYPVPSAVPSPDLQPKVPSPADLMKFADPHQPDIISGMSQEEKKRQMSPLCRTPTSEMLQFAAQCLPGKEMKNDSRAENYLKDVFIHSAPPPSPLAYDPYNPAYQYYPQMSYGHYPQMTTMPTYQPYCLSPSPYAVYYPPPQATAPPPTPGGAPYQQPQMQPAQYFTYDTVNVTHSQVVGDPGKALLAMISPKEVKEESQESDEKVGTAAGNNTTSTPAVNKPPRRNADGSPIDENSDHVKAILAFLSPFKEDGSPVTPSIQPGALSSIAADLDAVGEEKSHIVVTTPPGAEGKPARNIVMEQIAKSPAKSLVLESEESEGVGLEITDSVEISDFDKTTDSEAEDAKGVTLNVQQTSRRAEFAAVRAKEEDVNMLLSRLSIPANKNKLNRTPSDTESDLDSSRSGASPKSGTPKRSRIAAKFNVPIETDRTN